MAGQTWTARMVAREVSKRTGRDVDAKRVRAWVRDNVDAYDDDGYTAHVYDARTKDRIVAAFVAKAKGATGTNARSRAASEGRGTRTKGATTKGTPPTDRKRTVKPPVPPMASDKDAGGDA